METQGKKRVSGQGELLIGSCRTGTGGQDKGLRTWAAKHLPSRKLSGVQGSRQRLRLYSGRRWRDSGLK